MGASQNIESTCGSKPQVDLDPMFWSGHICTFWH